LKGVNVLNATRKMKKINVNEIQSIIGHGRNFPELKICLTDYCNYKCSYCINNSNKTSGRNINTDKLIKFIHNSKFNFTKFRAKLFGGEPTLHPDFWEICSAIKSIGLRNTLFTNLSQHISFYEKLVDYDFDIIFTSLHFSQIKNINKFFEKINIISKIIRINTLVFLERSYLEQIYNIMPILEHITLNGKASVNNSYNYRDYKNYDLSKFDKYVADSNKCTVTYKDGSSKVFSETDFGKQDFYLCLKGFKCQLQKIEVDCTGHGFINCDCKPYTFNIDKPINFTVKNLVCNFPTCLPCLLLRGEKVNTR